MGSKKLVDIHEAGWVARKRTSRVYICGFES
jgi:hypothetical protein